MYFCTVSIYPSHVLQSIHDRVEKLEGHLLAAKKKLEREKSGKVGFKWV